MTPTPAMFAPLLFAGEWELALRSAVELGYDSVEVSLRDPLDPLVSRLGEAILAHGLALSAVATGQSYYGDGLSLGDPDPAVQTRLARRLESMIDFAAPFGAAVILGGVRGKLVGEPAAWAEQKQAADQAIVELADYARPRGVRLLLEPINRYETNFLNTIRECLEVIERLGADNLGVLADTFHMNIEERSMPDALRVAGKRLGYVHFADSNRRAPGQGHIDFAGLVETLCEIGYEGTVCAEILPIPDSRGAAELAMQTFRELLT